LQFNIHRGKSQSSPTTSPSFRSCFVPRVSTLDSRRSIQAIAVERSPISIEIARSRGYATAKARVRKLGVSGLNELSDSTYSWPLRWFREEKPVRWPGVRNQIRIQNSQGQRFSNCPVLEQNDAPIIPILARLHRPFGDNPADMPLPSDREVLQKRSLSREHLRGESHLAVPQPPSCSWDSRGD
jgi:hypothetical protein